MTAHSDKDTGIPEVSKVEFEEKSGLNMSLCEDLPKIGGDCNGIVQESAEDIDGESKDDGDGSYVFVDGADTVSDDPVERDLDTECLVDPSEVVEGETVVEDKTDMQFNDSFQSEEKQVSVEELGAEEGGNSESCNKENLVSFANRDVSAEGSEFQTNRDEENQDSVTTGIEVIESDSQQFDNEDMVDLEAVVEENQESSIMVNETVESELHQVNNGEGKVVQQTGLESVAELEENQDHFQTTVPDAIESKLHQLNNEEEKVEEKSELETEKNQESQLMVTDSVEYESLHIENEEQSKESKSVDSESQLMITDSAEEQTTATEAVESELHELDNEDKETAKVADEIPVEEPQDDSRLESEATNGTDGSEESMPICPIEQTISETEVINDSSKGHIRKIEGESKNEKESVENTGSLACPADDLKLELNVGDESVEGGKSMPADPASFTCLESEVGNVSVERMSTSSIDLEARIDNGSIENDHAIPITTVDAVEIKSEVTNVGIESCNRLPISPLDDVQLDSKGGNSSPASNEDSPSADAVKLEYVVSSNESINDVANEGDQSIGEERNGIPICEEVEGIDKNGSQPSSPEDPTTVTLAGQKVVDEEVQKKPFHFLIRIPRYVDDKIKDQIKLALPHVDEKTRIRDAIRAQIQSKRAIFSEYHDKLEAARSEERAARDALNAKRQEMNSIQLVFDRMKDAASIEDIADRIHSMEYMIEHETMPLKEEKQLLREIKELKHQRDQLRSSLGRQAEIQPTLEQRERAEERFKLLKLELESARNKVLQSERTTSAARKIYLDESEKLKELQSQFRAADDLRQEAYTHLQNLKKQLYEKNKYFRMYKEEFQKAEDYASIRDTEGLEQLCVNQVNTVMELWNKNDEFRHDYLRCNTTSTLRRLRTLDGRSLGPDEEPPLPRNVVNARVDNTLIASEQGKSVVPLGREKADVKFEVNVEQKNPKADVKSVINLEQKIPTVESKKGSKPATLENVSVTVSGREELEEKIIEVTEQSKEEEELARKAEELRKEEAAARLKEQLRLEEKTKAKEAEERKKRKAEKAQARAELRAQKEAELKEKEREKRARKKEKKVAGAAASGGIEAESVASSEPNPTTITQEPEIKEKATVVVKRPQKPSLFAKQTKTKAIPPPLRNRSKRRMQPWMWILLAALVVVGLFLVGNSGYSSKFGL